MVQGGFGLANKYFVRFIICGLTEKDELKHVNVGEKRVKFVDGSKLFVNGRIEAIILWNS